MGDAPTRVGDHEIEAELGAGGMARVFRARHAFLDTHHAIKVLDPEHREAKIQAKHLDHPNIVKVTNIVATAEHAALVMELIDGTNLEALVPTLGGKPAEIKRIMRGVLDGVGHAHKAGIVHRDLKPANVLLARQGAGGTLVPKVTDFGIAKVSAAIVGEGKKSTHGDVRMGTLVYMSPEQVRQAKSVTPLGHLLAGRDARRTARRTSRSSSRSSAPRARARTLRAPIATRRSSRTSSGGSSASSGARATCVRVS